jgi:hypothetical protein
MGQIGKAPSNKLESAPSGQGKVTPCYPDERCGWEAMLAHACARSGSPFLGIRSTEQSCQGIGLMSEA